MDFKELKAAGYYSDCVLAEKFDFANSMEEALRLWDNTEKMIEKAIIEIKINDKKIK
jgi:hypothetical protein